MRADIITQAVPHADPDFLRILDRIPDPSPDSYEISMRVLPRLHELFLEKREAASKNDGERFMKIVHAELKLLEKLEQKTA